LTIQAIKWHVSNVLKGVFMLAEQVSSSPLNLRKQANAIRALSMDAIEQAKSGHPGLPMGMADVATVLFAKHLKFSPEHHDWFDRDRFVLSAGHGSMLLYALLYLTGYPDMTLEEIKNFRQLGSRTAGHPEYGHATGIETTTGPLGQGLANGVGMAFAEKLLNAKFGNNIINHKTFVLVGDGCLMEGISHEAASLAGHHGLNKLVVLFDDNKICIDGPTSLTQSDDTLRRFESYGWNVTSIDGHDFSEIDGALENTNNSDKPTIIACRTTIGYGAPTKAGTAATHGAPLGESEIAGAREKLNWPYAPFEIPQDILDEWRTYGKRCEDQFQNWQLQCNKLDDETQNELQRLEKRKLPENWQQAIQTAKQLFIDNPKDRATRASSGMVLDQLAEVLPELIGGSADLTGSNNTKAKHQSVVTKTIATGNYIHYGIREHAMAAAMNGITLHGGFIPYGGTFLSFADYNRPAIRLAALMGIQVIHIMTHDSIGLGEDGPTHQPVEHLASLRAIPNLQVLRPADAIETAECWEIAIESQNRPTVMVLSRQNLPQLRHELIDNNLSKRGAYILRSAKGAPEVTLIATGSEVALAVKTKQMLDRENIITQVVSMPSWELFDKQSHSYRETVLPSDSLRISIEAGISQGWERYVISRDHIISIDRFGMSAPAEDLFNYFNFTPAAIASKVKSFIDTE
jgi:transketolase